MYLGVELALGYGAVQGVKNSAMVQRAAGTLAKSKVLRTAGKTLKTLKYAKDTPGRIATTAVIRGLSKSGDLSAGASRRVLSGAKTVGRKVTVRSDVENLDRKGIESLSSGEQRAYSQSVSKHGADDIDRSVMADGAGRDPIDILERDSDINPSTAKKLDNLHDEGEISDSDIEALLRASESGDIDNADIKRAVKLFDSNNEQYIGGPDVTGEDLVKINKKGGDLENTIVAVIRKTPHGRKTKWMTLGDVDDGWIHSVRRHITGYDMSEPRTSFFPIGQTVKGRKLPKTMAANDVKRLTAYALKHGEVSGNKHYIKLNEHDFSNSPLFEDDLSKTGITDMRVYTENGMVTTTHPHTGSKVRVWLKQTGDGSGWKDGGTDD